MSDLSQLTFDESIWLGFLLLQILGLYSWCWTRSSHRLAWFQPPLVLSVIFIYYTVLGPLQALQAGDWTDRGMNLRYGFSVSWQGASVAFASFLVGYGLLRQRLAPPTHTTSFRPSQAWRLGRTLNIIGLSLFALTSGPALLSWINPFTARDAGVLSAGLDLGFLVNYAFLAINLLIPGILLMTAAWAKSLSNPTELVLWILVSVGLYTTLGFRYRLALLSSGMLILWFLARGRQPSIFVVIPSLLALLALAGLIGMTRLYGQGLDLSNLEGVAFADIILAGFSESVVFLTSGAVMTLVPDAIPFAGFTPLINTLLYPIPSALIPGKDSSNYLFHATGVVYDSAVNNTGSAILNYAEYFLMGGWPALIAGYILLGWLFKRLWLWFSSRRSEPIAQVTYVCTVVYLYLIVSRGYLPQVAMLFVFTVLPLFVYYYRMNKIPETNSPD